MPLLTLTPPAAEPVALAELKSFMRIDPSDNGQDDLITSLAIAARDWCENFTQRRFITQTIRLETDWFPGYVDSKLVGSKVSSPFVSGANSVLVGIRYAIVLPYPPVQEITTFSYLNANGSTTTMTAGTDYIADLDSQPARLTPPFGQVWPVARVQINAVKVDYKVGYGDDATDVPDGIKVAIKMLTNYWFEQRLPDGSNIPAAVKAVLGPFRDLRF
jgi:hypothetical protein